MRIVYFTGATRFEFQIGKLWLTILRPKYIGKRNLKRLILLGWEN